MSRPLLRAERPKDLLIVHRNSSTPEFIERRHESTTNEGTDETTSRLPHERTSELTKRPKRSLYRGSREARGKQHGKRRHSARVGGSLSPDNSTHCSLPEKQTAGDFMGCTTQYGNKFCKLATLKNARHCQGVLALGRKLTGFIKQKAARLPTRDSSKMTAYPEDHQKR